MFYFVYYSVGCGSNCCRGQHGNFRRHKVGGGYGTQGNGVIVSSFVAITPTLRISVSTAKYWAGLIIPSALSISSLKTASASRRRASLSSVISPMIRTASPGPGNGWRVTRYSGRPSSLPDWRTSSLNKSRRGSTISLKSTKSGRPPTLWWLLMVADSPPRPLSTTSG